MNNYYDNKFLYKNDETNERFLYLLGKSYYSQVHEHPLVFLDKTQDNGWACNAKDLINKCFSGITFFNQSDGIPRFRCEKCDFDLCENCMNYYRTKKFYEINRAYKVSCHSHALVYLGKSDGSDGWKCDGVNLKERCLSGITDFDQSKGFERFRCEKCDFDFDTVPAKWAHDGSVFVYEKDGNLYFGDPKAVYQKVQMREEFRKIGEGSINCVNWANAKYLVYINRDLIYKISSKELYTRGLYSPMVGIGIVTMKVKDSEGTEFEQRLSVAVTGDPTAIQPIWSEEDINVVRREFFTLDGKKVDQMQSHEVYLMKVTDSEGCVHAVKVIKN